MTRAVAAQMKAQGRGAVVNVSSIAGVGWGAIAYTASKGALNTMTLSLARAPRPGDPGEHDPPRVHPGAVAGEGASATRSTRRRRPNRSARPRYARPAPPKTWRRRRSGSSRERTWSRARS
jgi:3-oxoacyl-[acyl-carrier protein] reductase